MWKPINPEKTDYTTKEEKSLLLTAKQNEPEYSFRKEQC
jgi:hypothetical protein